MLPAIVWLRQDLRLADNLALQAARRPSGPVVPVFVWAPEEEGAWPPGSALRSPAQR
jgi:deoxyribodipyrimidine photo-lyase